MTRKRRVEILTLSPVDRHFMVDVDSCVELNAEVGHPALYLVVPNRPCQAVLQHVLVYAFHATNEREASELVHVGRRRLHEVAHKAG